MKKRFCRWLFYHGHSWLAMKIDPSYYWTLCSARVDAYLLWQQLEGREEESEK